MPSDFCRKCFSEHAENVPRAQRKAGFCRRSYVESTPLNAFDIAQRQRADKSATKTVSYAGVRDINTSTFSASSLQRF